jgi:hypothetical protein
VYCFSVCFYWFLIFYFYCVCFTCDSHFLVKYIIFPVSIFLAVCNSGNVFSL